jgi:DNA repair protein RadA/Sms
MAVKRNEFVFLCSSCGHQEPKWLGRCPECGEWNTLVQKTASSRTGGSGAVPMPLAAIEPLDGNRIDSGIGEMNRVLGGGIMKKSAILVGGEPGIGKSTLLLQAVGSAITKARVLYVSGEESAEQIKLRAERLGVARDGIEVFCSAELADVERTLEQLRPVIVVIDSIQTLHADEAGAVSGTVNQIKFCCQRIIEWAKTHDAAVFLIAHVTKEGTIAGPKSIEHLVDTVLYFDQPEGDIRLLRATKNRFGSTDEIGLFSMEEKGLIEIADPASLFLIHRDGASPAGVAVAPIFEGSRALLVEIQALTVPAKGGISRVFSDRVDVGRVSRVSAVLEKQSGTRLFDQDIYVNIAGGMKVSEVGMELALALAVFSARTGRPLPPKTAVIGELTLSGEVRTVRRLRARIRAAEALGFERLLCPAGTGSEDPGPSSCKAIRVATVGEAIRVLFGTGSKVDDA